MLDILKREVLSTIESKEYWIKKYCGDYVYEEIHIHDILRACDMLDMGTYLSNKDEILEMCEKHFQSLGYICKREFFVSDAWQIRGEEVEILVITKDDRNV